MIDLQNTPSRPDSINLGGFPVTSGEVRDFTAPGKNEAASEQLAQPASAELPSLSPENYSAIAKAAAQIDAHHFDQALDRMFRAQPSAQDRRLTDNAREQFVDELARAEVIVHEHLGSPNELMSAATQRFLKTPLGSRSKTVSKTALAWFNLGRFAMPVAAAAGTFFWSADYLLSLAAGAIAGYTFLLRTKEPSSLGVPSIIHSDWELLRKDVINATLSEILAAENKSDQDTRTALRRLWDHLQFIVLLSDSMNSPMIPLRMLVAETPAQSPQAA